MDEITIPRQVISDMAAARFYQGRIADRLIFTTQLYERYGQQAARIITGLSEEEAEFYNNKLIEIQGCTDGNKQKAETMDLYEEVMGLIDIRICQGQY